MIRHTQSDYVQHACSVAFAFTMRILPLEGAPGTPPRSIAANKGTPELKPRAIRLPQKRSLEKRGVERQEKARQSLSCEAHLEDPIIMRGVHGPPSRGNILIVNAKRLENTHVQHSDFGGI